MSSLFRRLRDRKMVQWALAYLAAAWVVFQVSDAVGGRWQLPDVLFQGLSIVLVVGFFVTLVLAWYHGEKGRQRVGGVELVVLALLLAVAGFAISKLDLARTATPAPDLESDFREPGLLDLASLAVPTVAVLPFDNLGSEESAAFTDGVHEEVIHTLAQLTGLIVMSRQSVLRYRGSDKPMRDIAAELDAEAVLEGSVRTAGDRVRVTVQLIDGRKDAHLWSETFEETLSPDRLFAIQEKVAREIAMTLQVTLTPEEDASLAGRPTESLDARTVFQSAQLAPPLSAERERLLHLAIEMDSTYDRPWSLLARELGSRALRSQDPRLPDSALAMAEKAIAMHPASNAAGPYHAIGMMRFQQGRVDEARAAFEEGMRRAPSGPGITNGLGYVLQSMGRFPEAVVLYRRAIRLNPAMSSYARGNLAHVYAVLGFEQEARREIAELQALHPLMDETGIESAHVEAVLGAPESAFQYFVEWAVGRSDSLDAGLLRHGAWVALLAGDLERARQFAARAYQLDPDWDGSGGIGGQGTRVTMGYLDSLRGDSAGAARVLDEAYAILEDEVREGSDHFRPPLELAKIEAIRGNVADATEWLETAHERGFRAYQEIELDPMFDALRGDAEFERIMARMRADVEVMREEVLAMEAELEAARAEWPR